MSSEEQQRLIQESIEKVNINRDLKKKQAKDEWIALHGDAEEDAMKINYVGEEMEEYDNEEDYMKNDEGVEGEEDDEEDNVRTMTNSLNIFQKRKKEKIILIKN